MGTILAGPLVAGAQPLTQLKVAWDQADDMALVTNLVTKIKATPLNGAPVTLTSVTNKLEASIQLAPGLWTIQAFNVTRDAVTGQETESPPSNALRLVIPREPVNFRRKMTIIVEDG